MTKRRKPDPSATRSGRAPAPDTASPAGAGNDDPDERGDAAALAERHVRGGWWLLLVFVGLGLGLEAMHGLKVGFYLDVSNETRRLMWTLAHTHGTLLAVINIVFGLTLRSMGRPRPRFRAIASRCLAVASLLVPAGFFGGGVVTYAGDPGLLILLVPAGAVLLMAAIAMTAAGGRA